MFSFLNRGKNKGGQVAAAQKGSATVPSPVVPEISTAAALQLPEKMPMPAPVSNSSNSLPPEILDLFSTVNGKHLDPQQIAAIADDSATELVVAGAGTGKTTTLVGKVKYLVNVKKVPLKKILIIFYTNNTVDDLKKTIQNEFGTDSHADIRTIHSIGYKLIKGKTIHVNDQRDRLINGKLIDLSINNPYYAKQLISYVEGLIKFPYVDCSLGSDHVYELSLREAANILTRCGIGYKYVKSDLFRHIKAHLTINREDHPIRLDDTIEAVKNCAKNPVAFRDYLKTKGLRSEDLDDQSLAKFLFSRWGQKIASEVGKVISRSKSTQVGMDKLSERNRKLNRKKPEKMESVAGRLELIRKVYEMYREEYAANDLVDYEDMIIQPVVDLESGHVPDFSYDYVLVDEYQDISPILVRLLLAMRRHMNFGLFCVGDDWQSIYSFRGGDISQMYDFDNIWKDWGKPSHHKIETTYRCPLGIVDVTNKFVVKNTKQIEKKVRSYKTGNGFPIELLPTQKEKDIAVMVGNRLDTLPDEASVFIIGRTNNDVRAFNFNDRFSVPRDNEGGTMKLTFRKKIAGMEEAYRNIRVTYITAHSAKGLEADYVFLLADRDKKCFPSEVDEDISSLFPEVEEDIDLPEERRLFYVAMTRARERLFVINRCGKNDAFDSKSSFVEEIIIDNLSSFELSTPVCSLCNGPMLVGPGGSYECFRYPKCDGVGTKHVGKPKKTPSTPGGKRRPIITVPYGKAPVCPLCGGPTIILRMWGKKFYGCAAYPECKGKLIQIFEE